MFTHLNLYPFLNQISNNRENILHEYLAYKKAAMSGNVGVTRQHLQNMENDDLIKTFCLPIYTNNKIGTGQVKNGLFNFTYTMPDKSFKTNKVLLTSKYNLDYFYINDSSKFFDITLKALAGVKNLIQCMFVEMKNGCIYDTHTHSKGIIAHHLLNDCMGDMVITVDKSTGKFNNDNRWLIFDGSLPHSCIEHCQYNRITLALAFYENN
jgi:hypothetical protein